ncbi:hypothetical protein CKAH01_04169 [Colletotrichum kahawae]|uniref:Uncharacterized protein n=1 Tax=Colletotrichum kahawae TaxID=34407 RepID=A0AAD9YMT6_COLKA|nr:hypothetical protein CKAH01_04169 [Colletotrichum kahawae]
MVHLAASKAMQPAVMGIVNQETEAYGDAELSLCLHLKWYPDHAQHLLLHRHVRHQDLQYSEPDCFPSPSHPRNLSLHLMAKISHEPESLTSHIGGMTPPYWHLPAGGKSMQVNLSSTSGRPVFTVQYAACSILSRQRSFQTFQPVRRAGLLVWASCSRARIQSSASSALSPLVGTQSAWEIVTRRHGRQFGSWPEPRDGNFSWIEGSVKSPPISTSLRCLQTGIPSFLVPVLSEGAFCSWIASQGLRAQGGLSCHPVKSRSSI